MKQKSVLKKTRCREQTAASYLITSGTSLTAVIKAENRVEFLLLPFTLSPHANIKSKDLTLTLSPREAPKYVAKLGVAAKVSIGTL